MSDNNTNLPQKDTLKYKVHQIIFEATTFYGRAFDIALLALILLSITGMMLESVDSINETWHHELIVIDWVITVLFSIEYILRIWTTGKPIKYIFSFYGIVDLLSIIPTYLGFFFTGANALSTIRAIRLLRVFRVLKLVQFVGEASSMSKSIRASANRIVVFLVFVLIICMIIGSVMYLIESPESGFTSIPKSIYWAVVTLTTVGYGDIYPVTGLGQLLAMVLMIVGYGVIAVPTGLVTAEFVKTQKNEDIASTRSCSNCSTEGHDPKAMFCKDCGAKF